MTVETNMDARARPTRSSSRAGNGHPRTGLPKTCGRWFETADFCCVANKLVIQIDGEPHTTEEGRHHDQRRDRFLTENGYRRLRIPGYELLRDAAGVRHRVESAIDQRVKELRSATDSLRGRT